MVALISPGASKVGKVAGREATPAQKSILY